MDRLWMAPRAGFEGRRKLLNARGVQHADPPDAPNNTLADDDD